MSDLCFKISNFPIGAMLNRARLMGAPKNSEPGNTCWKCYELKAYELRFYAAKWLRNWSRTAFLMPPWYMALNNSYIPNYSFVIRSFHKSADFYENREIFLDTKMSCFTVYISMKFTGTLSRGWVIGCPFPAFRQFFSVFLWLFLGLFRLSAIYIIHPSINRTHSRFYSIFGNSKWAVIQ